MRPLRILTLAFLLFTLTAAAQTDRRIEEQKRVIAALEKRIATEEQEISKIQKGRTATEERVRRLACQIDSRNQLLDETEKQARLLRGEIARTDSVAGNLSAKLERDRAQYGEMVREAYRNYKHNNYLTYIFSSRDFAEGHRTIRVYTREKAIELEVFAADVVDASSEGKRTDFADAAALAAYLGDKLSRCEVVLEEPSDVAQAWAFVTCSYQTSNSRTVVYAKEVEGWDSRPSE